MENLQPPFDKKLHTFSLEDYDIEDYYQDPETYELLKKLPTELVARHIAYIENNNLSPEETVVYLQTLLEKRGEAVRMTEISDKAFAEQIAGHEDEILAEIETSVFRDAENLIGHGQTARIKRYTVPSEQDVTFDMAIKYLVTPTSKTLSASAEHDMIREVERIRQIEQLEKQAEVDNIRVPHPFFHHKNPNIQCYGMELIDGADFERSFNSMRNLEAKEKAIQAILALDIEQVEAELELFFTKMHEYCLHGDIKPRNFMFNSDGKIYLIDFGQSVLVNDVPDVARDQLEELKEAEIRSAKFVVRKFIKDAQTEFASD